MKQLPYFAWAAVCKVGRSLTYVQPLKKRIIFFSLFGLYYFMIWKSVATALSANGRHGRSRSS